ncbi:SulP family inorganic anion transporter [Amycolatopsis keratiniphila]|uniref:Sodium-independent anion transporter n=1 Tax=Amycolatopsis keratiniphila subsp. keratiniphila TaxID=227715 RepID=A0A1W2LZ22_9PSEU|nr:SulP family inorganic anion transporter [Amycolatopsis keratiniphila]OLZ58859.1 sodium-independent anion transporter [Amycolatopsis keratiniphila subsp. nogabecina]ONF72477.1 sodium-independent anion transporter [Amycolatopsis keratiniphila subsp. keratiniphila]SDU70163.1 sulfate permease, SulP family [Amycolatopsis keratiniphila]
MAGLKLSELRSLLPGREDLRTLKRAPRHDLTAGLTVAIVALPLALGFGISSGLGAEAGLVTAIVAGALAAIFGGSNLQVSGPTGAMTVVLVPITATHGAGGVLTVGLLAGVLLLLLAVARAGRYMRYVPTPVVEGFTLGIAGVIALQQVPAALGVATPEGEKVAVVAAKAVADFAGHPAWPSIAIAAGVAALMLLGARWRPSIPFSLVAVAIATLVSHFAQLPVARIGALPNGLPAPSLDFLDLSTLGALAPSAVAVAALAALESLLSATVADAMSVNERHDPDRELFGQGLANLVTPLFGGVPATAAIARTAVNVRAGAKSRLASFTHAMVLAVIVFAAAPLVATIPIAALAGVLLATAVRMVEAGSVRALLRSTRRDALVLVLTAAATLILDLVTAVILGLVVAGALALRAIAKAARIEEVALDHADHAAEEQALLDEHIVAFRLDGPLVFAAAHQFLLELSEVADVRVVILRMSRVSAIDATGALVLRDAIERLEHRGITVLVSGIKPGHEKVLDELGVADRLRAEGRVFPDTPHAIDFAHALLTSSEERAKQ